MSKYTTTGADSIAELQYALEELAELYVEKADSEALPNTGSRVEDTHYYYTVADRLREHADALDELSTEVALHDKEATA